VTGRLTREGVECQAFRSKNGKLYTLSGNLRGFKAGDRVRVTGRVAEVSTCMQGTTLSVESIRKIK
jgi:TolB-like protein